MQSVFSFPFVGAAVGDIAVTSIDSSGNYTPLTSTQFSVTLNPAVANQLWGLGGNVTITGGAPAAGTQLLIERVLPLTQQTSIQNQGNYYSQSVEQALDLLEMQIQQVSARTGQFLGTWASGNYYAFGDIIIDGANGANTGNYYMCIIDNTSGTWATDLSNGDWSLALNVQLVAGYAVTASAGATTATAQAAIATTQAGIATTDATNAGNSATAAAASATSAAASATAAMGYISSGSGAVSAGLTDNLGYYASGGHVISPATLGTNLSFVGNVLNAAAGSTGFLLLNHQVITSSGTYIPTPGMLYAIVVAVGAGGGSGGVNATAGAAAGGGAGGNTTISVIPYSAVSGGVSVTIGAGGTAGSTSGTTGGNGGVTLLYNTSSAQIIEAPGGKGGLGSISGSVGFVMGGQISAAGIMGDINIYGGAGGMGITLSTSACIGGFGGSSFYGGSVAAVSNNAGIGTSNYGGGAAGSSTISTAKSGGAGYQGVMDIYEYCT